MAKKLRDILHEGIKHADYPLSLHGVNTMAGKLGWRRTDGLHEIKNIERGYWHKSEHELKKGGHDPKSITAGVQKYFDNKDGEDHKALVASSGLPHHFYNLITKHHGE